MQLLGNGREVPKITELDLCVPGTQLGAGKGSRCAARKVQAVAWPGHLVLLFPPGDGPDVQ